MLAQQKALLPEFKQRLEEAVRIHGMDTVCQEINRKATTVANWLSGAVPINPPSSDFGAILGTLRSLMAPPPAPAPVARPKGSPAGISPTGRRSPTHRWRGPKPMQRARRKAG